MQFKILRVFPLLAMAACQPAGAPVTSLEDAPEYSPSVPASAETTPTLADGATDPAIWINAESPQDSLILGSGLAGGLEIYELDGTRIGVMSERAIGLVDVRYNFALAGNSVALVVAHDAATAEIIAYPIDAEDRSLHEITTRPLATESELEGLCLYQSPLSGKYYVFAAGGGVIQQWELFEQDGKASARRIRDIPVGLGAGHCVVHDRSSSLYFSQETVGVFKINAEPESEAEKTIVDVAQPLGHFAGDVKGIAIQEYASGGYLLVSDADVSRLHFYNLDTFEHAGILGIDDVEEAEGIAVTSVTLSSGSEGGLLVVADDDNGVEATNYKIVSWSTVADALSLTAGIAQDPTVPMQRTAVTVSATVETEPVKTFGDAADDPAIWVHPDDPELSLIIGTQKKNGINVYDLSGNLLQSRADGNINNVDLRYDFSLGDQPVAIVAGSNRSTDSISIYAVDAELRKLVDVADGVIPTGMIEPYGACMYRSAKSDLYYVIINDTDGLVKQWVLEDNGKQRVAVNLVREFSVGSQTEGCVADDETGDLYIGEEDVGIWKYSAEPDGGEGRVLVDGVDGTGNLTSDVEGLAIYYGDDGAGYLVASNQGADSYALYERAGENRFIGIFHVVADDATGIDGSSETDGIDVSSAYLGPNFPNGIFVAQDGRNITPDERQNFKLVPWQRISDAMGMESTDRE
jgi:3-phytase